jgi:aldose 1-epimerase
VDGTDVQLDVNELATGNCLHGGSGGFHSNSWMLKKDELEQSVTCSLHSPDDDQGFPGSLDVRVVYRALNDFTLSVEVSAQTDAATVVNLAHHPYFNLDPENGLINDHRLRLVADSYTPVDGRKIPTGEISDVVGTIFDFRERRQIEDIGLDHNFVLNSGSGNLVLAAELYSPQSRIRLRIRTTQPGLQVYTADFLDGDFAPREGIALETQNFPDAPNKPEFPSALLLPGSEYRHQTVYEFEVD